MNKGQVAVIGIAIALIVLLLFANTKPSPSEKKSVDLPAEISMEQIAKWALDSADANIKAKTSSFLSGLDHATSEQKLLLYDSLTIIWNEAKKPAVAAYYAEQKLNTSGKSTNVQLLDLGLRYLGAARFSPEKVKPVLYAKAAGFFKQVTDSEPDNLSAKTNLGISYVEGTDKPMEGITLLKEVVSKDSTNFDAQLNLGLFSIRSGQYDKAVIRFEKLLKIKPDYIEAYLFLADAYERVGDKAKTVEMLEKYSSLVSDPLIKDQVKEYINKLKNT